MTTTVAFLCIGQDQYEDQYGRQELLPVIRVAWRIQIVSSTVLMTSFRMMVCSSPTSMLVQTISVLCEHAPTHAGKDMDVRLEKANLAQDPGMQSFPITTVATTAVQGAEWKAHKPLAGTPGMGSWPYSTRIEEPIR